MRTYEIANGFKVTKSRGILFDINEYKTIEKGIKELHSKGYDTINISEFKEPVPEWIQFEINPEKFASERNPNPKTSKNVYAEVCIDKNEVAHILVLTGYKSMEKAPFIIKLLEANRKNESSNFNR